MNGIAIILATDYNSKKAIAMIRNVLDAKQKAKKLMKDNPKPIYTPPNELTIKELNK